MLDETRCVVIIHSLLHTRTEYLVWSRSSTININKYIWLINYIIIWDRVTIRISLCFVYVETEMIFTYNNVIKVVEYIYTRLQNGKHYGAMNNDYIIYIFGLK